MTKDQIISMAKAFHSTSGLGDKHGFDADDLIHQIQAESNFDIWAVSGVGAMGLMQIMPKTCVDLRLEAPFRAEDNVRAGVAYMLKLGNILQGKYPHAPGRRRWMLAAYNWGIGNVLHLLDGLDKSGKPLAFSEDILGIPAETRKYVKRILG